MTIFATEHHTGFSGTTFGILWTDDQSSMPGWQQEAHSVTRHVPGGDVNVTQLLGHGVLTISYRLLFESKAEFATFMALRQTSGTLTVYAAMCEFDAPSWEVVIFGETYVQIPSVTLMSTADERTQADGTIEVTATFQLQERPS